MASAQGSTRQSGKICPVEPHNSAAAHQSQLPRPHPVLILTTETDGHSCARPSAKLSVRLILQPGKRKIEILHEIGVPTRQTAGGT
ncbi:hypothetical protein ACVIHF_000756 [Bradyrhizobium sp. USDA 4506]